MRDKDIKRRLILLVEPKSSQNVNVREWLKRKGLLTWRANDVSHAIEELSDFTVKNRPDVVMLEVSPLSECFQTLREGLCRPESQNDVSVVAMCGKRPPTVSGRFFATDFSQLETIIDRETGPRPRQAAMHTG